MNKKREAREFCFQYFFHVQLPVFEELKSGLSDKEILSSIVDYKESTNTILSSDLTVFSNQIILGTFKNYKELELIIEKYLKNWKLSRISKVDHTILLLSSYEMLHDKSTPVSIIINEAIEISKKFGSVDSGPFVNGILDNLAKNEVNA
jgi:N utilization substance protein B